MIDKQNILLHYYRTVQFTQTFDIIYFIFVHLKIISKWYWYVVRCLININGTISMSYVKWYNYIIITRFFSQKLTHTVNQMSQNLSRLLMTINTGYKSLFYIIAKYDVYPATYFCFHLHLLDQQEH